MKTHLCPRLYSFRIPSHSAAMSLISVPGDWIAVLSLGGGVTMGIATMSLTLAAFPASGRTDDFFFFVMDGCVILLCNFM